MDTIPKQQKLPSRVISTILKVSKFVISRALYFIAGVLIAIVISVAYAAWNDKVGPGDPLTSTSWNDMVDKLKELDNRTIAIKTGVLNHGQKIPLPAGYAQNKCKWFVSLNETREFEHVSHSDDETFYVRVNANRVVYVRHHDGASGWGDGKVNYIIICQ